jgi:ubiquinone/menaquinone biosynthesis C-methylase UbiE
MYEDFSEPSRTRAARVSLLRSKWNRRTHAWHEHVFSSPAFAEVREALIAALAPSSDNRVVDLGAGTGFITLAIAPSVCEVLAVDLSEKMRDELAQHAAAAGMQNVRVMNADLATFDLPEHSFHAVVSNYALHHLSDAEKIDLVARAFRWLVPGGRLVVADMMFGRGATSHDRRVIRMKLRALLKKGPTGLWRITKNVVRLGLRLGTELPAPPEFWVRALENAGFEAVRYTAVIAEAGVVRGVRPA